MIREFLVAFGDLVRFVIIFMPGPLGVRLRYWYYKGRLKRCGKNVIIREGVVIENPQSISVGHDVCIDTYCLLTAGKPNLEGAIVKRRENTRHQWKPGELILGSHIHIGAFNILQAHGGLTIGNNVTTSAGVKIYSLSNAPYDESHRRTITFASCMAQEKDGVAYIVSPIVIEDGVWLGLDCLVLGGTVGENSFAVSQSVVLEDIPRNSYAAGCPARRIKERFHLQVDHE